MVISRFLFSFFLFYFFLADSIDREASSFRKWCNACRRVVMNYVRSAVQKPTALFSCGADLIYTAKKLNWYLGCFSQEISVTFNREWEESTLKHSTLWENRSMATCSLCLFCEVILSQSTTLNLVSNKNWHSGSFDVKLTFPHFLI